MKPPIEHELERIKLLIARTYYAGPRYIKDKQAIADSLSVGICTPDCGYVADLVTGRVWVVSRDAGSSKFNYTSAN